ncbi:hypothetical protein FHS82_001071 [Pseudochelatococcus lubricantis]|uniref:Uncharacterized protein n=1 Tax=Pseudochelatococcus lubricantis TaxID=1538102 RepID=A0ABX0UZ66_9HYPH|nr:hypothetical protein [Pseudochelatococcus lubricantis]NIJ57245.1 hypothetical protein [Pseudochelatococcus lubricantis]
MANTHHTTSSFIDTDGLIPEPELDTIDKVISETFDLYFLLEVISDEMTELDFSRPDGSRNIRLDRISALIEVARRQTRTLHNDMAGKVTASASRRAAA